MTSLSKWQVSIMARDRDDQAQAFRTRPLDEGPYTFVAADALGPGRSAMAGGVVQVHALLATGVNGDGHREILGVDVSSDAHSGLVAAIAAACPGASWQRCKNALRGEPDVDHPEGQLAVGADHAALDLNNHCPRPANTKYNKHSKTSPSFRRPSARDCR